MNEGSYKTELLRILRGFSKKAIGTLKNMDEILPSNALGIQIGVHPNQEPDGFFSVLIHLDGPDLYALNRAIQDHRYLFHVRHVGVQIEPQVPIFEPYETDFEVNDVIVDTCIVWLKEIWADFGGTTANLPAIVFGEDGYGTNSPQQLWP